MSDANTGRLFRKGSEPSFDAVVVPQAHGEGLLGDLAVPDGAGVVVVFAHGSGSSRTSPRNRVVASALFSAGHGALLVDLLTEPEAAEDEVTRQHRFDIALLADRLVATIDWWTARHDQPVVLFGASTGAAAALIAAAERPRLVPLVISRGGRTDLAGDALERVQSRSLLIVGGRDPDVLQINQRSAAVLGPRSRLVVVPGASHLFAEPGALSTVAELTVEEVRRLG
jgi:putative phosphoribosyl transferase